MTLSLGLDSSNYRSSAATVDTALSYRSTRKLLPVKMGERGLRQSDAVFAHTRQLPGLLCELLSQINPADLVCVGVSDRPRRVEGSYMPCFLPGVGLAEAVSAARNIPLFRFSHQEGHIAAALLSAGRTDLLHERFIAFHISGGTTEAVLVRPAAVGFETEIIGKTLDLHAGQVIDRVGVMLGLPFPSGEELERLAQNGRVAVPVRPCIKGFDCALSGVENICKGLFDRGEPKENIAATALSYVSDTLCTMAKKISGEYTGLPFVFSGGVMANRNIRREIGKILPADFASPELSGDNAVGIALLAMESYQCSQSN